MNEFQKNIIVLLAIIALICGWWFMKRPSDIAKECSNIALEQTKAHNLEIAKETGYTDKIDVSPIFYQRCLHDKGIVNE